MRLLSPSGMSVSGITVTLLTILFVAAPIQLSAESLKFARPEGFPAVQQKDSDLEIRKLLKAEIDRVANDPEAQEIVNEAGQRRTPFCNYCHGKDGNAVRPEAPSLAGQNPVYLLEQFQRFADGRRKGPVMSSLAPTLKPEERIMLAIYYSGMKIKPAGGGTPEQKALGKKLFEQICVECHGIDGKGSEGYARIAGQNPLYTSNMLKKFKNQTGQRVNPWMTAVSVRLSDEEIDAVSMYLANLE